MVKRNSSLFIAAITALLSFVAITWLSCNKSGDGLVRCEGVICENGGLCHMDTLTSKPACACPTGFEGANCATASAGKYIGTWSMRQVITGSDTASFVKDTSYYTVFLVNSATPTTFFINNFANNPFYNQIICTLDSANSSNFAIDTLSDDHMLFANYKLTFGYGSISADQSMVSGIFGIRHLSATSNWINDTIMFTLSNPQRK